MSGEHDAERLSTEFVMRAYHNSVVAAHRHENGKLAEQIVGLTDKVRALTAAKAGHDATWALAVRDIANLTAERDEWVNKHDAAIISYRLELDAVNKLTAERDALAALYETVCVENSKNALGWANVEAQLAAAHGLQRRAEAAEAALNAACGYLTNAMVDLETGAPKRTAIATIKGGLVMVRAALAAVPS